MIAEKSIKNLIDNNIHKYFENASLVEVIDALQARIDKFTIIVCRDNPNIVLSDYDNIKIDLIDKSKLKYNICQLRHCANRIEDIKWIILNRKKFPKYTNKQVFNLIILKEKLMYEEG